MAKNFGKFVLATAVLAGAGAAAYYYLQKRDLEAAADEEYEDYDDFKKPEEPEKPAERSYVNLTPEPGAQKASDAAPAQPSDEQAAPAENPSAAAEEDPGSEPEKTDDFTPLEQVAQAAEAAAEETRETVEEFFDEDDPADEEPAVSKD